MAHPASWRCAGWRAWRLPVSRAGSSIRSSSWRPAASVYTVAAPGVRHEPRQPGGRRQELPPEFPRVQEEFPLQDDLVVVVESEDPEKNRQFVERLGARLEQETNLFTDVFYKGDLKMLGQKALLFVPETEPARSCARRCATTALPPAVHPRHQPRIAVRPGEPPVPHRQARGQRRERGAGQGAARLRAHPRPGRRQPDARGTPPSPGIDALFERRRGGRAARCTSPSPAAGSTWSPPAPPTSDLNGKRRRAPARTGRADPARSARASMSGSPASRCWRSTRWRSPQKDTTLATSSRFVLCALIFIYGYSETGRPLKADLCLLVGLAYTMAFTTFAVGHLNILTVTFVPDPDRPGHRFRRAPDHPLRGGTAPRPHRARGAGKGHGLHRPGHLHRLLHHRRRLPGHGRHRFQRHPGDGHHLRRRPARLPGAR